MIARINDFLLSEWLWSITWDWYHVPISIVIMFVLFNIALRINIVPAVFIALSANIYSFLVYTLLSFGVLHYFLAVPVAEPASFTHIEPLQACIYLGLIYTAIQISFFMLLKRWHNINVWHMVSMSALGNLLTALIVHSLLLRFI